jgi:hypothetical protein
MSMRDSTVFRGRKIPDSKYRVVSKLPARLKSFNRPVPKVREETLPPDSPQDQFTTKAE